MSNLPYLPWDVMKLPGEPDILTEKRLRFELKELRGVATQHERLELLRSFLLQHQPGVFEAQQIFDPLLREHRGIADPLSDYIRRRLLAIEAYFIEKGWRLPPWERPSWLLGNAK